MRKLTIRTKLTLWYGLLFLILLVLFNFFIYITISRALKQSEENLLKAHINMVTNTIAFEGLNVNLNELYSIMTLGTFVTIYNPSGVVISGGESQIEIAKLDLAFSQMRELKLDDRRWIIYDEAIYNSNKEIIAWVRGSRDLQSFETALLRLRIILFSVTPIYMIIAVAGGLFLSNRALSPISRITSTAREIEKGDLSRRLKFPVIEDEVGKLAMTFDEMLDMLESSLKREKQFTSDVSHELRTPIAIISSQAEEALREKGGIKKYEYALKNILQESRKMSFMFSQLLMLSRSESGRYSVNLENLDLKVIIEEVVNNIKKIAEEKGVTIYIEPEGDLKIEADQTLVTRMFVNLIDNAIKYSKKEGHIKIISMPEDGNIKIIIEDNGIGIPEEDLPHIFERFYRVDRSRIRDGFGLGLFIVRWIVDIHRGQITVKSTPDKGTTFVIHLPIRA